MDFNFIVEVIKERYHRNLKRFTVMIKKLKHGEYLSKIEVKELEYELRSIGGTGYPLLVKLLKQKGE